MLIPASKFLHFVKSHTCVGEKVQQVKFDQLILIPGKLQVIDQRWVHDWLMVVFQVWDGLTSTNIHNKYYQEQHGIIKKFPAENNMSKTDENIPMQLSLKSLLSRCLNGSGTFV